MLALRFFDLAMRQREPLLYEVDASWSRVETVACQYDLQGGTGQEVGRVRNFLHVLQYPTICNVFSNQVEKYLVLLWALGEAIAIARPQGLATVTPFNLLPVASSLSLVPVMPFTE